MLTALARRLGKGTYPLTANGHSACKTARSLSSQTTASNRFDSTTKALDRMIHVVPDDRSDGRLGMPAHLERMCNTPLLSADEERQLFRAMNFLKYRADLLRSSLSTSRPSVRKMEQVQQALTMSLKVRNRLVNSNVRLVISIVHRFSDSVCSFDDLLSEGIRCLINAVEKFDYDRGFRFSTYATSAVRRELYRLVQRQHRDRSRYATGTSEKLDQSWQDPENPNRSERVLAEVDARVASLMDALDDREKFIVSASIWLYRSG